MLGTSEVPSTLTINNGMISIARYTGLGGAVVIPCAISGLPVTSIGSSAFQSCSTVTSIAIPNSVTNIGEYAFAYCTGLTAISVDPANPIYASAEGALLDKSQSVLILCPEGTAGSYTIPNSVTNIGGLFVRLLHSPDGDKRGFGESRLYQCGRGRVRPEPKHSHSVPAGQS